MTASETGFDQSDAFPFGPVVRTESTIVLPIHSWTETWTESGPGFAMGSTTSLLPGSLSPMRNSIERTLFKSRFSVVLAGTVNANSMLSPDSHARKSVIVTGISRVGGMGG